MEQIFLQILNMSFAGSVVILFVLLMRLMLKKAPKFFSYLLWSVVLFRLICPFSFESAMSLLPVSPAPIPSDILYAATPQLNTGIAAVDQVISSSLPVPIPQASVNPLQIWIFLGSVLWLCGIAVLIVYSVVSLFRLKKRLADAEHDSDNIYLSAHIDTSFVLGVIHPKIYLPESLSGKERAYILLHEWTHIRRLDHIVKLLSFFVLCVHWFNPLVWVAFFLSGKDMEMSCDEAVIKKMGTEVKKDYSSSLLSLATGKRIVAGTLLAFGEGDTKERIKNVLNYKKPAFWVVVITLVGVITLSIGLMANPKTPDRFVDTSYRVEQILYNAPLYSFIYTTDTAPQYTISDNYKLFRKELSDEDWGLLGDLNQYPFTKQELYALFVTLNNNTHENLDKVKTVYRTDVNDDNQTFILVMQQQNGDVLLAHGYENSNSPHIRWLFKLKKITGNEVSGQTMPPMPTPDSNFSSTNEELSNIGQDAANFYYSFYMSNDVPKYWHITKHELLSLEVTAGDESEFTIWVTSTIETDGAGWLIGQGIPHDPEDLHKGGICPEVGREFRIKALGNGEFEIVSVGTGGGTQGLSTIDNIQAIGTHEFHTRTLEEAVSAAILEHNAGESQNYNFACESHVTLTTEVLDPIDDAMKTSTVTVYAMVLYQEYNFSNNNLINVSGSHIPTAITFYGNEDGEYTLKEYWIPRDGSHYASDIEAKFPEDIYNDALDTQKYILAQTQSCYAQAIEYGKLDTVVIIEKLLETIMSSPAQSSNPNDYIEEHPIEYRELTYYNNYTLRYVFSEFLKGGQTGLKGHIMASVSRSILGDAEDIDFAAPNGQEWFDAFRTSIEASREKHGEEFIKTNAPKSYLLLTMLSDNK